MNSFEFLESLPGFLAERVCGPLDRPAIRGGLFVLYWMRTAMRDHENPALEVALAAAAALNLPTLVYQGLSDRCPYASDRHHQFILQGAKDVQASLAERHVNYAFYLERRGSHYPHLRKLAEQAAIVVTEDVPVQPLRRWTRALAGGIAAPLLRVDTACLVPMRVIGKAYERAFEFRKATRRLYDERLKQIWPNQFPRTRPFDPADLPFEPLDLQQLDLSAVIGQCEIDHAIAPVPHTVGGTSAGYARWEAFKRSGLQQYASRRNDPLRDGTSRLSAYLHYGMVSPFRIVREAAAVGGAGAEKFLDELLIIVTAPAPQTAELVARAAPQLSAKAGAIRMQGCWAVMVGFAQPLPLPLDGAFVHDSPLAWVARDSSKPNRGAARDCWVLHANPQWSDERMEHDKDEVAVALLSEFWRATGLPVAVPDHVTGHRWRFAIPPEPLADRCLVDRELQIIACGDWCSGPRVEGALLSGLSAAGQCLRELGRVAKRSQQLSLLDETMG